MGNGNTLRALHLAGAGIGAVTKAQLIHLGHHRLGPFLRLRTALRKQRQGTDARSHEKHRRTVLTGRYASTATDARSRIHAFLRTFVGNQDIVGILRRTGTDGNEAAGLQDLVKRTAVHHQVLDDRESGAAPRLDSDCRTILEMTHEQLAGRHMIVRTMRAAVNIEGTGTADTLAAIMIERHGTTALATLVHSNRVTTFPDQLLIEDIEHFKERSILFNPGNMISLEMSLILGVLLTPYFQIEFHCNQS